MRAIIIGAGIAGLAAANALRRIGIDATVFERSSDMRQVEGGRGLILWHNAVEALRRLELAEPVQAQAPVLEHHEFRSWRGELLADWHVGDMGRKIGIPTISVSRPALHSVLLGALDKSSVHLDSRCTGFEQSDTDVTVRFADGREEHADLLIGADGINSVTRAQLLGRTKPQYAGYTAWQAVVKFDSRLAPAGVFRNLWGRGSRFLFFRVDNYNELYWDAIINGSEDANVAEGGRKAALLTRFRGWQEPIEAMIDATPESEIRLTGIYDRESATRWGVGRVTLVGDAAHPMTFNLGQGACQAIEDAVVIAGCLRNGRQVAAALRAYEEGRIARTTQMVKTARLIGALGLWEAPVACWLRDQLMKLTFNGFAMRKNYELMMDYRL